MEGGLDPGKLFEVCDLDGSGYIDETELGSICRDLPADEVHEIFLRLDKDGDGQISVEEFTRGFKEVYMSVKKRRLSSKGSEDNETAFEEFTGTLEDGLKSLSCQEQVIELYQQLHSSDSPEVLEHFESIILGVIKDLKQYKTENERLEKSFKREKNEHEKHLRQLEDEMEIQMQKVEERVRKQEQDRVEAAKASLKREVENEISELQHNLSRLQQEGLGTQSEELEQQLIGLREKLEEINVENRQLKSELTGATTNMAVVKSELVSVKQQYLDKCRELHSQKATVMDCIKEQDKLTRQLHLLHNANRQLHDTNDDLREVLEKQSPNASPAPSIVGSLLSDINRERRGSVMSDYVQSGPSSVRSLNFGPSVSLVDDVTESLAACQSPRILSAKLPIDDTCEEDNYDIADSGHSTLRDQNDIDTDSEIPNLDFDNGRSSRGRRKRYRAGYIPETDEPESHDEMETETETNADPKEARMYKIIENNRFGNTSNRRSGSRSRTRDGKDSPTHKSSKRGTVSKREPSPTIVTKVPERIYKVVLAGDAAVGKSSFIMRLCKGKFVSNISSTLGVDFQTKLLDVDNKSIALQLWDTAGQERFRSIAKSYFRRADGVLLLYDCTYERSFLNIREWVESIEESSHKKIPIMFVANKTDLREESQKQGRRIVKYEDGQRLAREYAGLFIETSAKDGSHIAEAVTELSRLLRANEDLEVKTVGLQLHDGTGMEKKSSCCGK